MAPAVALLFAASAQAQVTQKTARATRVEGAPPRVDGVIDEPVWQNAVVIADFTQKVPVEGAAPSVSTEVRLLYDDAALYVAARLGRADPEAIRTSITRRDGESDAEVLRVSFDPYFDHRTAYSFAVSSGGVRSDWYHPQDDESTTEVQFDPVWSARARVDDSGWTAEMRIPFSQLRFNHAAEQIWGLQITRDVADKSELDQWVLIPQASAGYASHFGRLIGIADIPSARRIELMPYVAGDLDYRPNVEARDPFDDHAFARAGADLKMGLGPNLTLDATFNPDFGQVEADPAEVNLTAFETVFEERRPFFVEGNALLTGQGQSFLGRPTWFYSRRVGAPPHAAARGDFVKQPSNTTIPFAAKVTGRMSSGLSVAGLAARTAREHAEVYDTLGGLGIREIAVEPPNTFGVVRMQQEFGAQQSNFGATMTVFRRDLDGSRDLAALLPSSAIAGGGDWKLRFKEGMYEVTGWVGGSRVEGDPLAIARLQRASAHYFQRPDQDYVRYDSTRTALTGVSASIRADKNAGRYTLAGIQLSTRSPEFDINDAGQMRSADDIDFNADIQLRDTQPNRLVRYFQFGTSTQAGWNYGGVRQYARFTESGRVTLHNFWNVSLRGTYQARARSDDLSRGGPLVRTPSAYTVVGTISGRPKASATWSARADYFNDELGGSSWSLSGGLTARPSSRWNVALEPTYSRAVDSRQYVATVPNAAAVFGQRYVFSFVERSTVSSEIRVNYALTPNLTVEGYGEPFAATGRFYDFGELPAPGCAGEAGGGGCPGSLGLRRYGAAGTQTTITPSTGGYSVQDGGETFALPNPDFSRLSFRSNVVLRWEWRPGSVAYLVWQQARQDVGPTGRLVAPRDLLDAAAAEGSNVFVLKVSYWLGIG